jgi:hypothetical protein
MSKQQASCKDAKARSSEKEKKMIRNSTAEFLIFTGQAGEQGIAYELGVTKINQPDEKCLIARPDPVFMTPYLQLGTSHASPPRTS